MDAGDFSANPYEFSADAGGQSLGMLLKRSGQVTCGQAAMKISLEKKLTLSLRSGIVSVDYRFINNSDSVVETIFGSEWNINLLGGGHNESAYYRVTGQQLEDVRLDSRGEIDNVRELFMGNTNLNIEIRLSLDRPLTVWRFPVESISNSEGGVEEVYQCSCVVILLPLKIEAGTVGLIPL